MVTVEVDRDDAAAMYIDRDGHGVAGEPGKQGFVVSIGGAEIRFAHEDDAVTLANRILLRMGREPDKASVERDCKSQMDLICDVEERATKAERAKWVAACWDAYNASYHDQGWTILSQMGAIDEVPT